MKQRSHFYRFFVIAIGFIVCGIAGLSFLGNTPQISARQEATPTPTNPQVINAINTLVSAEDCTLPCWWGLMLNTSTLLEIQEQLAAYFPEPFSMGEDSTYIALGKFLPDTPPNSPTGRSTSIQFWVNKTTDALQVISLYIERPTGSYVDFSPYLPAGILSTYGSPDVATLTFFEEERGYYDIYLAYHELGLYAYYGFEFNDAQFPADPSLGIDICNDVPQVRLARIWIQSENMTYSEEMQAGFWDNLASRDEYGYDIEGVTTLSLAEFTQLFSQPNTCFQTLPFAQWVQVVPTPSPTPSAAHKS